MPHYWLTVFILAIHNSFVFIGKSTGGFIFDVCVVALAVYRLWRKHGWREMRKKALDSVLEGVIIAIIAGAIVFAWKLINAPAEMQAATEQRVVGERALATQAQADWKTCTGDLSTQTVKAKLLGDQKDAQQVTIDSQQSQLNSQQGTMNSCVVNLGKMNPIINTKTGVTVISVATNTTPSPLRLGSPTITYFSAIVISTNRRLNFEGRLKCTKAFILKSPPTLPMKHSGMMGSGTSVPISDKEFDLKNDDTAGEWDAADPIFLVITSNEKDIGPCTFTQQQ